MFITGYQKHNQRKIYLEFPCATTRVACPGQGRHLKSHYFPGQGNSICLFFETNTTLHSIPLSEIRVKLQFVMLWPSIDYALYMYKFCGGVVGWCDGAGLTSSAGASYNLDYSRARAYCTCSRCGWGLFGHFYPHLSFLSSFSLSLGDGPI